MRLTIHFVCTTEPFPGPYDPLLVTAICGADIKDALAMGFDFDLQEVTLPEKPTFRMGVSCQKCWVALTKLNQKGLTWVTAIANGHDYYQFRKLGITTEDIA